MSMKWIQRLGPVLIVLGVLSACDIKITVNPTAVPAPAGPSNPTAPQLPPTGDPLAGVPEVATPVFVLPSLSAASSVPSDPEAFIRWYFGKIVSERDYDYLWGFLTDRFKSKMTPGGIAAYKKTWDYITGVNISSITPKGNANGRLQYTLHMRFNYTNGTADEGNYNYYLLFDDQASHWMFDSK